jgi:hypothetical protein
MTQARRYYHEVASVGHQDVLQYRHSGGICPDEYKVCIWNLGGRLSRF